MGSAVAAITRAHEVRRPDGHLQLPDPRARSHRARGRGRAGDPAAVQEEPVGAPLPGPHRFHWSDLLARVFGVDAFACPRCDGRMTVRAVVLPGPGTLDVLSGLQGAARAPPAEDLPAA